MLKKITLLCLVLALSGCASNFDDYSWNNSFSGIKSVPINTNIKDVEKNLINSADKGKE